MTQVDMHAHYRGAVTTCVYIPQWLYERVEKASAECRAVASILSATGGKG